MPFVLSLDQVRHGHGTMRPARPNAALGDATAPGSLDRFLRVDQRVCLLPANIGGTRCPQRVGERTAALPPIICAVGVHFPSPSEKSIHRGNAQTLMEAGAPRTFVHMMASLGLAELRPRWCWPSDRIIRRALEFS